MIMKPSNSFCPFARGDFEPRRVEDTDGSVQYTSGQCSSECALSVSFMNVHNDEPEEGWKCGLAYRMASRFVKEVE